MGDPPSEPRQTPGRPAAQDELGVPRETIWDRLEHATSGIRLRGIDPRPPLATPEAAEDEERRAA